MDEAVVEREVTIEAAPEDVWSALVDPERISQWFGGEIEWDLTPGGELKITRDSGEAAAGVVQEVKDGEELKFLVWSGDEARATETRYLIESTETATRLVVIERTFEIAWTESDTSAFQAFACAIATLV